MSTDESLLALTMLEIALCLAVRGFAILVIGATARFSYKLYHQRMRFRSLASKYGLVRFSSLDVHIFG
jgi:hypothetical protein